MKTISSSVAAVAGVATQQELTGVVPELFDTPAAPTVAATEVRRPCIACDLSYLRPVDAPHRLCPNCAADLNATAATIAATLAAVDRRIANVHERWQAHVSSLSDEVAERWSSLVATRDSAAGRLTMAETGSYRKVSTAAEITEQIAEARARVSVVAGKIGRTRASRPEIAALLDQEAAFMHRLGALNAERTRWLVAQNEVAAEQVGDDVPF